MIKNMDAVKRLGLILALSVIFLQLNVLLSGAQTQTITGLSSLVMSQSNSSIYLNSSIAVPFRVVLASGTPGTTYLIIANGNALASKGIYVGFNASSGTPSFNDVLYVNTNIAQGVVPGVYKLMIESGGADPIYPGIFNYTITVYSTPKPQTTATSGSTTSYSVTSAPTTIAQTPQQSSNLLSLGAGAIIVILIIIILVFLAMRAKK